MLDEKSRIYRELLDNCSIAESLYAKTIRHEKINALIEECKKHPKDLLNKLEEIRRLINER